MPESIGQTFSKRAGPLPVWAWAGLGTAGLAGYLYYRNKQKAAAAAAANTQGLGDSSNLGTVPISDLTTEAQPMPIQMGDTFVNVNDSTNNNTTNNPVQNKPPTASTIDPGTGLTKILNPAMAKSLAQEGYAIYQLATGSYYNPHQPVKGGEGANYVRIADPQQSKFLAANGCKIYTVGNTQFYQYPQCKAAATLTGKKA